MSVFTPFRLSPLQAEQSEPSSSTSSERPRPAYKAPLRSILKKCSKVLKSDLAAARYMGEVKKPGEAGLPSFSLSGIVETSVRTSGSVETAIRDLTLETPTFQGLRTASKGRSGSSPSKRSPSGGSPVSKPTVDSSLSLQVALIIESIKEARDAERARQVELRKRKKAQVLGLVMGDKERKKESVNADSDDLSGSETESATYSNNRLAMKLAVRQYANDPQQREELLRLIDSSGTPRLSILMKNNRVEGLYKQGQNGFVKVYGSVDAPERVQPSMVRKCFEFKAESLSSVPQKQLWKADAFSL